MKVNTDGVLLGAAVGIRDSVSRVIDVGTGTGTIALLLAQRLNAAGNDFHIKGIDIDEASAEEAALNFERSPWAEKLQAEHIPLQKLNDGVDYDLIVSNPPYYPPDLQSPDARKNVARHSEVGEGGMSLSYGILLQFAADHLTQDGILALIFPASLEKHFLRDARSRGLHAARILRIRTTPNKAHSRLIVELSRHRAATIEEELTIQENGKYTSQYISLTSYYYL